MSKSGSKSVSGAMSKPLSRLWAVFLFLVTFVSTAAHAPGQILLSAHNGPGPKHKARVQSAAGAATLGHDGDQFAILSRWEDDAQGAYYSAWNPMPRASDHGSASAWDAFPPNSLLASSQAANEALAQDALHDYNRRSLAASWGGGGSGGGGAKGSGKAPGTAAPTQSADTPADTPPTDAPPAPDTTQPPAGDSPPDDAKHTPPGQTPPGTVPTETSPPDNTGLPPAQHDPVNVPEPATFGLFALSLAAMALARRRAPARRRG